MSAEQLKRLARELIDQCPACQQDSYWWITPTIAGLSAAVAFVAFILTQCDNKQRRKDDEITLEARINSDKATARRRATLDLIERVESTDFYRKNMEVFGDFAKSDKGRFLAVLSTKADRFS